MPGQSSDTLLHVNTWGNVDMETVIIFYWQSTLAQFLWMCINDILVVNLSVMDVGVSVCQSESLVVLY